MGPRKLQTGGHYPSTRDATGILRDVEALTSQALYPAVPGTRRVARLHSDLSLLVGRQPKGRRRDLESRAVAVFPAGVRIVWMKARQFDKDATMLRTRPEQWPRVRLPALEPVPDLVFPVEVTNLLVALFVVGPHQRVVEHAICLLCDLSAMRSVWIVADVSIHTGKKYILPYAQWKTLSAVEAQKENSAGPGLW
eukprot:1902776-Amphidinium_carterae.1